MRSKSFGKVIAVCFPPESIPDTDIHDRAGNLNCEEIVTDCIFKPLFDLLVHEKVVPELRRVRPVISSSLDNLDCAELLKNETTSALADLDKVLDGRIGRSFLFAGCER